MEIRYSWIILAIALTVLKHSTLRMASNSVYVLQSTLMRDPKINDLCFHAYAHWIRFLETIRLFSFHLFEYICLVTFAGSSLSVFALPLPRKGCLIWAASLLAAHWSAALSLWVPFSGSSGACSYSTFIQTHAEFSPQQPPFSPFWAENLPLSWNSCSWEQLWGESNSGSREGLGGFCQRRHAKAPLEAALGRI